jgi:hypothetical protein
MSSDDTTTTQSKPVTVEVPEDRVAEFYAFYARFLAGRRGRRGRHGHGRGHHGHGGCHGRGFEREAEGRPAGVREV